MPLSWNEIRLQALNFAEEWKDKAQLAKEEADAQDFQTGKKGIRERGTGNRVQVRSFRHNQIGFLIIRITRVHPVNSIIYHIAIPDPSK